jgi:hypothetical protein
LKNLIGAFAGTAGRTAGAALGLWSGGVAGDVAMDHVEDKIVDESRAMQLAKDISNKWLTDFKEFTPRPVGDVVNQLLRLREHMDANSGSAILDTLRRYLYGKPR